MTDYSEADRSFNLTTTAVGGVSLPMKVFEGIDYKFWSTSPDNIQERLNYIRDFQVRPDDVFVCSYPKSGTNWVNEIVYMLHHGVTEYAPLFIIMEIIDTKSLEKVEYPRVFVTHLPFQLLPRQLEEKGKLIYVVRNPKDVAVSYHCYLRNMTIGNYEGDWNQFFPLFMEGNIPSNSWFDHVLDWEKVPTQNPKCSMLTVYYEDLKRDLKSGVENIAAFIGSTTKESTITEIVNKCVFKNLYHEKTTKVPEIVQKYAKNVPNFFYRKGITGDWKNWFTVAQNERFDTIYKTKMEDSSLDISFTI